MDSLHFQLLYRSRKRRVQVLRNCSAGFLAKGFPCGTLEDATGVQKMAAIKASIGCVTLWLAGSAVGQAFNIDFGRGGQVVAASSYGAAAGQPGFWNPGVGPAFDLNGNPTSVTIFGVNSQAFLSKSINGANASDAALMADCLLGSGFPGGSETVVAVGGLIPGQYRAFIYGWAGQQVFFDGMSSQRKGTFDLFESSSGQSSIHVLDYTTTWPGAQVKDETYFTWDFTIGQTGGYINIRLLGMGSELLPNPTVCNGIQIVPIPAPATSALAIVFIGAGRRRRTIR